MQGYVLAAPGSTQGWIVLPKAHLCFRPHVHSDGRTTLVVLKYSSKLAKKIKTKHSKETSVEIPTVLADYVSTVGGVPVYPGQRHASRLLSVSPFSLLDARSMRIGQRKAIAVFSGEHELALLAQKLLDTGGQQ